MEFVAGGGERDRYTCAIWGMHKKLWFIIKILYENKQK
jgi:hypothetical protein